MFIKTSHLSLIYQRSLAAQAFSILRLVMGYNPIGKMQDKTTVAVDDISLEVNEGERVGIIGNNGAGKTSLLQMISGLANATSGQIATEGRVTCIMTLGVGLNEECSGRENIYIDGEVNGKTRAEVDRVLEGIIDFADLGEFIDHPVRTYSSGMKSRLAFAMIAFIEPEILIIDEALSVGDTGFVAKASAKMKEICDRGKILVVVSHSMETIMRMCNRCIWMDKGRIVMDGSPHDVTETYREHVRRSDEANVLSKLKQRIGSESQVAGLMIDSLAVLNNEGLPRIIANVGDDLTVRIGIMAATCIQRPDLRFTLERMDGIIVLDNVASQDGWECAPIEGQVVFEIPLSSIGLGRQMYELRTELLDRDACPPAVLASRSTVLRLEGGPWNAVACPRPEWRIEEVQAGGEA